MNQENQEAMMAVERELQLAGTDPKLRKRWNTLEDRRITPEKEIPPMEFLFELFNKPCFPRGELVAMTGKAKSGKTFMSTILMEKCLSGEGSDFIPCLRRVSDEPLRAMWFDTEQSEESTQDILRNRLIPMISNLGGEYLDVFNVRGEFWQERLPLLEAAIGRFQPDLVILDGIRDLTDDINDGVKARRLKNALHRHPSPQRSPWSDRSSMRSISSSTSLSSSNSISPCFSGMRCPTDWNWMNRRSCRR